MGGAGRLLHARHAHDVPGLVTAGHSAPAAYGARETVGAGQRGKGHFRTVVNKKTQPKESSSARRRLSSDSATSMIKVRVFSPSELINASVVDPICDESPLV